MLFAFLTGICGVCGDGVNAFFSCLFASIGEATDASTTFFAAANSSSDSVPEERRAARSRSCSKKTLGLAAVALSGVNVADDNSATPRWLNFLLSERSLIL